jgi:hypothetical protein
LRFEIVTFPVQGQIEVFRVNTTATDTGFTPTQVLEQRMGIGAGSKTIDGKRNARPDQDRLD